MQQCKFSLPGCLPFLAIMMAFWTLGSLNACPSFGEVESRKWYGTHWLLSRDQLSSWTLNLLEISGLLTGKHTHFPLDIRRVTVPWPSYCCRHQFGGLLGTNNFLVHGKVSFVGIESPAFISALRPFGRALAYWSKGIWAKPGQWLWLPRSL